MVLACPPAGVSAAAPKGPAGSSDRASGPPGLRQAVKTTPPPKKPAPHAVQTQSSWSWQNPQPNGNALFAISCPTTSTCFTAGDGGPILMTSDGGATWASQTVVSGLYSISCASTTACVAVGNQGAVWTTSSGGTAWSSQTIAISFLSGVSCPSAAICFAVGFGGAVYASANGGTSWSAQTSGTNSNLFAISCPSTSVCFGVGDNGTIIGTSNGGSTWGPQFPAGAVQSPLTSVSCATLQACTAVGQFGVNGVEISTADGTKWSFPLTTDVPMSGVACFGAGQCVATQINGYVSIFNQDFPQAASTAESGALYAISCPATGACFAAGDYGVVVTTADGGTGWKVKPPSEHSNLNGISCVTTSVCFAAGPGTQAFQPAVISTSDGGQSWDIQKSIGDVSSASLVEGISCPATMLCYALGYNGRNFNPEFNKTIDGGRHWTATPLFTQAFLFAITCPSSVVCYAVGQGAIFATTDGAHWSAQAAPANSDLIGVSCSTVSVCFAPNFLGGILATTNGGTTWTTQSPSSTGLRAISCPTSSVCFAVGDKGMLATADGGTTWNSQTPAGVTESFVSVSCATTTSCATVAMSGAIYGTADGATWTAQTSGTTSQLNSVSCPSASVCLAVGPAGLVIGTTDGGASAWKKLAPSGPTNDVDVTGMSCVSSSSCFALATPDVFATTNGGAFWSSVLNEPTVVFTGISCPGGGTCFVIGKSANGTTAVVQLFGTTDGGATWPTQITLNAAETIAGISCPTTTACYAVSTQGNVWTTSDGWKTSHKYGVTGTGLTAISCPSTTTCFATDNTQQLPGGSPFFTPASPGNVFSTTNGGVNWNLSFSLGHDTQAGIYSPFFTITCPTTTTCYAAGQQGLLATTTDGGANWRTERLPSRQVVNGISCTSASTCFATGSNTGIVHTADFGASWDLQAGGPSSFLDISCPTTTVCFAGGIFGYITQTTTAGAAWTKVHPAAAGSTIAAMSCSGASCYAAANEALRSSHDSGATWSTQSLSNGDQLIGIACPGANACFAVGWPGAIYKTIDGGVSWNYQPNGLSRTDETLVAISCASATNCMAVGTDGIVLSTTDGTSWALESSGTTQLLNGVSCASTTSCVAVGAGGLTLARSGGTWHQNASGTTNDLHAVSCPTVFSCDAVGDFGFVAATGNGGGSWTAQSSGISSNLYGIQCLQPGVCLAVGGGGTAILTHDGSTWSTLTLPTRYTLLAAAFTGSVQAEVAGLGGIILANPSVIQVCTSAGLSAAPTSPQPAGTSILVTATSSGCSNPVYEFWLQYPNGSWVVKQAFSSSATWSWNTAGYPVGNYLIHVWADQSGDSTATWESFGALNYTLAAAPPCATASLSPSDPSAPAGTTVALTASSTGCPNPQYEYWVLYPNGVWHLIQGWGGSTFNWNTSGLAPGTYTVHAWANQMGDSTASWEAYGTDTVTLTGCTSASLTPSSGSASVGTTVPFMASSSGCPTPVYKFWLQYPDGTWHMMRDFSTATTWSWNTTGLPKGTYVVHVWANNQGASTATWETYGSATYTLT
jgi:photosystem II stability/assembly factor-like uncharacterized protein